MAGFTLKDTAISYRFSIQFAFQINGKITSNFWGVINHIVSTRLAKSFRIIVLQ